MEVALFQSWFSKSKQVEHTNSFELRGVISEIPNSIKLGPNGLPQLIWERDSKDNLNFTVHSRRNSQGIVFVKQKTLRRLTLVEARQEVYCLSISPGTQLCQSSVRKYFDKILQTKKHTAEYMFSGFKVVIGHTSLHTKDLKQILSVWLLDLAKEFGSATLGEATEVLCKQLSSERPHLVSPLGWQEIPELVLKTMRDVSRIVVSAWEAHRTRTSVEAGRAQPDLKHVLNMAQTDSALQEEFDECVIFTLKGQTILLHLRFLTLCFPGSGLNNPSKLIFLNRGQTEREDPNDVWEGNVIHSSTWKHSLLVVTCRVNKFKSAIKLVLIGYRVLNDGRRVRSTHVFKGLAGQPISRQEFLAVSRNGSKCVLHWASRDRLHSSLFACEGGGIKLSHLCQLDTLPLVSGSERVLAYNGVFSSLGRRCFLFRKMVSFSTRQTSFKFVLVDILQPAKPRISGWLEGFGEADVENFFVLDIIDQNFVVGFFLRDCNTSLYFTEAIPSATVLMEKTQSKLEFVVFSAEIPADFKLIKDQHHQKTLLYSRYHHDTELEISQIGVNRIRRLPRSMTVGSVRFEKFT